MANSTAVKKTDAPTTQVPATNGQSLLAKFASRYSVEPKKLLDTLKATCFKGAASDEQMISLLIVADQYHLNPFTKEIYAFPDKNGGIVPVVGVDGWLRIINTHPQFDYMELAYSDDGEDDIWTQATIFRKDRPSPTIIREYMDECRRDTAPWKSHPRRMLRHKAVIQCGRVAFGFVGIYDPDEADRIVSIVDQPGKPKTKTPQARIEQPEQQPPVADSEAISLDQATWLADMIKEEGLELNAVLARMEVGSLEQIAHGDFAKAKAVIEELSSADVRR